MKSGRRAKSYRYSQIGPWQQRHSEAMSGRQRPMMATPVALGRHIDFIPVSLACKQTFTRAANRIKH